MLKQLKIFEFWFILLQRIFNILSLEGIFTIVNVDISIVYKSIVCYLLVFYFHHFVFGIVNIILKMALALQVIDCTFIHVHVYCIFIRLCVIIRNLVPFRCHFISFDVQQDFFRGLVFFLHYFHVHTFRIFICLTHCSHVEF